MAEFATVARPYAQALYQLGNETDGLSRWHDCLQLLAMTMQDTNVMSLYANPNFSVEQRVNFLSEICESQQFNLNRTESNFLKLLADNQRLSILPEIYTQYYDLQIKNTGYLAVEVISTYAIKPAQKKTLIEALEQRFNKKIELNVTIDRKILGGWVIRASGQVIDLSVRGRLAQLASTL